MKKRNAIYSSSPSSLPLHRRQTHCVLYNLWQNAKLAAFFYDESKDVFGEENI